MTLPFESITVAGDHREPALRELAERGGFFANLLTQYERDGDLNWKQWACVDRELERGDQKTEEPLADILPALADMADRFDRAGEHLKRVAILLCSEDGKTETRFQPAPAEGANAGWFYVKRHGHTDWGYGWAYVAKINPKTGQLLVARGYEFRSDLIREIKDLLANGLDAAVLHFGQKTGACGCCGRDLTEETSVKAGIGPVCADRYGIDRAALISGQ